MAETWIKAAISEVQKQIEEIERDCGPEHPDLAVKLERCANLLRQDGRGAEAERLQARAGSLRGKTSPLTGSAPALSRSQPLRSSAVPEHHENTGFGMSRLFAGIVAAMIGRQLAESNPYLACLFLIWLLISCLAVLLGTRLGRWALSKEVKRNQLVNKLACFGLFVWIFPLLGIFYGSMTLAMSRLVEQSRKRNLAFSYACITLSLLNSLAGIVLAGLNHYK